MSKKYVYMFAEGNANMRELLGGKGANLAEMASLGLPVPYGFTITTEACNAYYDDGKKINKDIMSQVKVALGKLEKQAGKKLGNAKNPLLVSVRSGARASMPGMMDTILNLGINDEVAETIAKKTNNERFAYDSYRRFIQMFSDVVMELSKKRFEEIIDEVKEKKGVKLDTELDADDMKELVKRFKDFYKKELKEDFPQDTNVQLERAIEAVFRSWNNPRAITYRNINDIPHTWGTAVNIVAMVFGNMGDTSATGVAFTRDPATGEKVFFGEYLVNAQGEDVVAGIRTPQQISNAGKAAQHSDLPSMEESMPQMYQELNDVRDKLEKHNKDMQDIEFTIQEGKLYLLQCRSGKRTAKAAVKIAVDLVKEGIVDKEQALLLVDPTSINQLLHRQIDPHAPKTVLSRGLNASPGAASGTIVFTAEDAEKKAALGPVILLREETSPDDITGMHVAQGVITARGGMTSHAAVVARGMGAPCITGCGEMVINFEKKIVYFGNKQLKEGDWISMSGDTGEIYEGQVPTIEPQISGDFETIMKWADETRRMRIEANAETPKDAQQARDFGAEGIGLVRTEHMFFDPKRIVSMRKMILADTEEEKKKALDELLPYQTSDFEELFRIMDGYPVTIRLLDPPLHEFLPKTDKEIQELAKEIGVTEEAIKKRAVTLHELNPMLGHRGCRLCISRPEITQMQGKAIFTAAMNAAKKGVKVLPQIMIPLAVSKKEIQILKDILDKEKAALEKENNCEIPYVFGTMIELPRACLRGAELASVAQFFSFGTNDLTQTTLGISRDDFSFRDCYKDNGIFDSDPFAVLDEDGVGEMIKLAVNRGKSVQKDLKTGICGEHGGEPKSIQFADALGMDYVSCSPFRIPIARLAAAQAVVRNKKK